MNLEKKEWKQARIKKKKRKKGSVEKWLSVGPCSWTVPAVPVGSAAGLSWYSARPCPSLTVTFGASLALSIAAIPHQNH